MLRENSRDYNNIIILLQSFVSLYHSKVPTHFDGPSLLDIFGEYKKRQVSLYVVWGPAPLQRGRVWQHAYIRVVRCSRNPATLSFALVSV